MNVYLAVNLSLVAAATVAVFAAGLWWTGSWLWTLGLSFPAGVVSLWLAERYLGRLTVPIIELVVGREDER